MNDHINSTKDKKIEDGNWDDSVREKSEKDVIPGKTEYSVTETMHGADTAMQNLVIDDDTVRKKAAETEPEISQFLKAEDNTEACENQTMDAASVVHGVGHMLRNARMARKLSVEDVSRQLRISVQQVEAIEKENFEELPGRTFVRGFVRNYANLMQLDSAAIVRLLPGPTTFVTNIEHTPFKIQEMTSSSRDVKKMASTSFVILILVFLALTGYVLYQKMPLWQATEQGTDAVVQQEDGQTSIELQLPVSSLKLSDTTDGASRFNQSTSASLGSVSAMNTFGTLTFNFSADAHVSVTDGNNDIIFEQNNIRGTQQSVSGKKPLSIVISNASAVEVNYNDRLIDIKPYTNPQDGSAQLILE